MDFARRQPPPPFNSVSDGPSPRTLTGWEQHVSHFIGACQRQALNPTSTKLARPGSRLSPPLCLLRLRHHPVQPTTHIPAAIFRVLLRRLRLPLGLPDRTCRSHRPVDALGDHRAARAARELLAERKRPDLRERVERMLSAAFGACGPHCAQAGLPQLATNVRGDRSCCSGQLPLEAGPHRQEPKE